MICNEPCGSAQLCCFPFETSRFFKRPNDDAQVVRSRTYHGVWGPQIWPFSVQYIPFLPPKTHGKIEVFGHLKTRLFTIKTSKHVGNRGPHGIHTYPTLRKGRSSSKNTLSGDMLVPSRVIKNDIDSISFAGIVKLHTLNGNNSFGKKNAFSQSFLQTFLFL